MAERLRELWVACAILRLFQATALLELGIETMDGTGAALAWPLIRSAAAVMTEVADAPAAATET